MMIKILASLAAGALAIAAPAAAHHVDYLDTPFPTRGACEAMVNHLSNDDDFLIDQFPQLFSSEGEVRSFLGRAFPCEQSGADGQYYIVDHRIDVLQSDWFTRRQ